MYNIQYASTHNQKLCQTIVNFRYMQKSNTTFIMKRFNSFFLDQLVTCPRDKRIFIFEISV